MKQTAVEVLEERGLKYWAQPDGSLFVPGNIYLDFEFLTELPDFSRVDVQGGFYVNNNQLTSLKGAPRSVGGAFRCDKNRLSTLEGAPPTFKELTSDFGKFPRWEEIPERLRFCPETRARVERERAQAHRERERALVESATVLKNPVSLRKPFKFR